MVIVKLLTDSRMLENDTNRIIITSIPCDILVIVTGTVSFSPNPYIIKFLEPMSRLSEGRKRERGINSPFFEVDTQL